MDKHDPLMRLEGLASRLAEDHPPPVHVVPHVMRRIRTAETASERTLELFAAASCLFAVAVVVVGLSLLSQQPDPLGAVFQIVPPIEF